MALSGKGVLAVWGNVAAGAERDFAEWYIREHLPERVGTPGFRRGRRFEALASSPAGTPQSFALYELDAVAVIQSPAYVARLGNPTPWTTRIMPIFLDMNRSACRVAASQGKLDGGVAAVIRFSPVEPGRAALRDALAQLFPQALALPGVVAAHILEGDVAASHTDAAESRLRRASDQVIDSALMVEATGEAAARDALALFGPVLREAGPHPVETYGFVAALSASSL